MLSDEGQEEFASDTTWSGVLIILLGFAASAVTLYLLASDFVLA